MVILEKHVGGLTESRLARFVTRARRAMGMKDTVNVLVTTSTAVRSLNRQFRKLDKATDVLSFPALHSKARNGRAKFAGEIAISADIAAQNSERLGHSTAQEIEILTLHGILHLAGFDHERDNGQMARKEAQLRRALRLPVGLIERFDSHSNPSARARRSTRERGTA